jgi:hypothetical protein
MADNACLVLYSLSLNFRTKIVIRVYVYMELGGKWESVCFLLSEQFIPQLIYSNKYNKIKGVYKLFCFLRGDGLQHYNDPL